MLSDVDISSCSGHWLLHPAGVKEVLQILFGTRLLLSQLHTSVVIPSYELETSSPFTFWHQQNSGKGSSSEGNKSGYVAMMRSAKAEGLQGEDAGDNAVKFLHVRQMAPETLLAFSTGQQNDCVRCHDEKCKSRRSSRQGY